MEQMAEINLFHIAHRATTEDSFYEILMAFINENGETPTFHKAAIAEKVNFSKPIVAATINALFCTGYLDEIAKIGNSKIYCLSELGLSLIQQIISIKEQS